MISDAYDNVRKGGTVSEIMKESGEFPPMASKMCAVGEETGPVDNMLAKVADFYEMSVDYAIKKFTALLEPLFLVILGGLAQMYVTIIGGQAFPMPMFPGYEVSSTFYDGVVANYSPSIWELILGLTGIGITFVVTVIAVRVLKFMPQDDFKTMHMRRSTD